ncbi:phosphatase PAP2 family protein [Mesorhizobium japonicum]|uniref:Mll6491 protein n=1 Tax=Mesorhizobium japonicum (strain LMG 29417 / CECT 9101 / MAFF 303099) TaxID=266835 RepID=Q989C0_RHILO|nr:phosphatase PAP2 family protein [Mesorhizobium japonicum]BAB52777.1 mll6491 [Mesorhizobium japonicum MAFF 303099]
MLAYEALAVRRYAQIIGLSICAFVLADFLCLSVSNVTIDAYNGVELIIACSIAGAYWVAGKFAALMATRSQSRPSRVWKGAGATFENIAIFMAVFIPMSIASCLFMYLAASTTRPRLDWLLVAGDKTLGFDWPSALGYANSHPKIAAVLVFCYEALTYQLPVVVLWHAVTNQRLRLLEFVAILFASSVLTAIIMAAVPVDGPYLYFRPAPSLFDHFTNAGLSHAATVDALRSGAPFDFLISKTVGITCFPSFHTTLGIIITYAMRRTPLLIPIAVVNAVMIVSTVPEGGHYLVDVIGGGVVAVTAIVGVTFFASANQQDLAQRMAARS